MQTNTVFSNLCVLDEVLTEHLHYFVINISLCSLQHQNLVTFDLRYVVNFFISRPQ